MSFVIKITTIILPQKFQSQGVQGKYLYLIIRILSSEFFQEMSESSNNSQSYFEKKPSTE